MNGFRLETENSREYQRSGKIDICLKYASHQLIFETY